RWDRSSSTPSPPTCRAHDTRNITWLPPRTKPAVRFFASSEISLDTTLRALYPALVRPGPAGVAVFRQVVGLAAGRSGGGVILGGAPEMAKRENRTMGESNGRDS